MAKLPTDLLNELLGIARPAASRGPHAAFYNQDAYRVTRSAAKEDARHEWWFSDPGAAEKYGQSIKTKFDTFGEETPDQVDWQKLPPGQYAPFKDNTATIPGKLNTKDFREIDAYGADWQNIPFSGIKDSMIKHWLKHRLHLKGNDQFYVTTDNIADAVQALNLPGVRIRNVKDSGGVTNDQFYVNHLNRRRSRFAKFEDPHAMDLLGGAAGLGLAGAASMKKDES